MSSSVIKEFLVALNFDVKGQGDFDRAVTNSAATAMKLGAAAVAAAGAVTAFVTSIANSLDDIADLGQRTNTAASEIDRLNYIAELTDSSAQAVAGSLESVAKNAGDAAMGIGRAKLVFEKIGISVKDANGNLKGAVPLMQEIGDKIKDMDIGQQNAVLERLGIDRTMLKMLTEDVSGLSDEYTTMMKAAGMNMDDAAKNSGDYIDSLNKLKLTMQTVSRVIASKFMRGIANSFETFRKLIIDNMPRIIATITPIIDVVMRVANAILFLAGQAIGAVMWVVDGFLQLNSATSGLAGYILAAVVAWKTLNLSFLASPIGIILSLAAAIALLYDDFKTWQEGGQSLLPWENWQDEINKVKQMFTDFMAFIQPITDKIFALFDKLQGLGQFIGQNIPIMAPSFSQAAPAGNNANVNQKTEIIVQGADNPAATARAVAGVQNDVNGNMARNLRGSAR